MPRTAEQLDPIVAQHSTDIAVLKARDEHIRDGLERIEGYVAKIDTKVDKVATSLDSHKTECAREAVEAARETSGLQTKYNLIWYIVGTLMVGTLVGKFLFPLLGL